MHVDQLSDGNGTQMRRPGTDGMMKTGITGVHPRVDSPKEDGLGTKATGTIAVTSSNMRKAFGIDSKVKNGLSMAAEFQFVQAFQEDQESVDHSTN